MPELLAAGEHLNFKSSEISSKIGEGQIKNQKNSIRKLPTGKRLLLSHKMTLKKR
jgi:hypothetical protein